MRVLIMSGIRLFDAEGNDVSNAAYVTVTISKANPTVTAPTAIEENIVYTGESQELIVAGNATGGIHLNIVLLETGGFSDEIPTAINAGRYTDVYYQSRR